jgi:hypothetical protein
MMNKDIQYKSATQGTLNSSNTDDNKIILWGISENPLNTISIK